MFSLRSIRKIRITSCASAPSPSHKSAISLAKHTFNAWKVLQTYLIISAVRIEVSTICALTLAYSVRNRPALSASSQPISTNGG